MRRILLTLALAALVAIGLGSIAVATSSGSSITRPRLERSVAASFTNVYTQRAALLGSRGVTPTSLHARAMCDKGPGVAQSGPGTTWNCLMSWRDPEVPMPSAGYGKFELTVHSNGCYTVGSPSSLLGYQTITDVRGRTVPNPVYEFDGCLDPDADDSPTGVTFPSTVTVTSTTATPDSSGRVTVGLACGVGADGCSGTVTAAAGSTPLGTARFSMTEQSTQKVRVSRPLPAGTPEVTYTVHTRTGVAPSAATVPVQWGGRSPQPGA